MRTAMVLFATALTVSSNVKGVTVSTTGVAAQPASQVQGPQIFINDTNTAVVLLAVDTVEPAIETTVPAEFDGSVLRAREERRGIGIGQQGSGTSIGPQSSEPTIGPQTSEPAIGQQGSPAVVPGISDQGLIFPAPNTIIIGPPSTVASLNPRTPPQAPPAPQQEVAVILPGLSDVGLIFPEPNTVALGSQPPGLPVAFDPSLSRVTPSQNFGTQDRRGIGIGLQGSGTAIGPQSSEPTIGPQSSEPAIGQQGSPAVVPGISDQGLIFPAPNTVVVGPPQFNARLQPGFNGSQPVIQTVIVPSSGVILVPVNTGHRHLSRASLERFRDARQNAGVNRSSAAGIAPQRPMIAPAPAPVTGGRR